MLLFSRTCRKKAIVFIILPSPPHSFPGVKHVGLIKGKESYKGKVGFTPLSRAPHSLRRPLPDAEGGGGPPWTPLLSVHLREPLPVPLQGLDTQFRTHPHQTEGRLAVESHFRDVFNRTVSMSGGGSREAALLVCSQLTFRESCAPKCLLWSPHWPPLTREGPGWEALGAVRRKGRGSRAGLVQTLQPRPRVAITFLQSPYYLRRPSVHENKSRPNPRRHTGRGWRLGLGRARGRCFLLSPTPKFLLPIPEFSLHTLLFIC